MRVTRRALLVLALLALCGHVAHAQLDLDEPQEQPATRTAAAVADAAFERADLDHNGQLDAREFASFTNSIKKALHPLLNIYNVYGEQMDQPLFAPSPQQQQPSKQRLRGSPAGVNKFWSGFMSGILTIWATEIGDKTFFIAAILSMKKDRVVVFAGAIGALIVMTVLSVVMGMVATKFLPPAVTHYVGAVLVRVHVLPVSCVCVTGLMLWSCLACSSLCLAPRCFTTRVRCRAGNWMLE